MSREILFRAWDKKLNIMWEGIALTKLLSYLIFQSCPNADAYMALKNHFKDIEWLEFTSLLDKNGKKIFEGDIFENQSGRGIIEWWPEHCCFGARKVGTEEMFVITSKGNTFATEVIGNIYENPEMVKP